MATREKQYVITMAFRMACFVSVFFVHGWLRWVVLGGAVFLPFIAVLFANQVNEKTAGDSRRPGHPAPARALTQGVTPGEVIVGELADDQTEPRHAHAGPEQANEKDHPNGEGRYPQDRVA